MRGSKVPIESLQRRRIRETAVLLFSQNGFSATSMRDIASATGLKVASLYAHLSSKEDLLLEVLDEMTDVFVQGLRVIVESAEGPEEKLRRLFAFHLGVVAKNLSAATVLFHEYRQLPADRLRRILKKRAAYGKGIAAILDQGVEAGAFRELDSSLMTIQILSVLNYSYHWFSPNGPQSAEQLGKLFADTFLYGLVPSSERRAVRKRN